jgi:hypothetical protein
VFSPRMTALDHAAIAVSIPSRRFFSSLLRPLDRDFEVETPCRMEL